MRDTKPQQDGLLPEALSIPQRFEVWRKTPGGKYCLQRFYQITAAYHGRMQANGQLVSRRLVWERVRDDLGLVRRRMRQKGFCLTRERGFWLNDHFTKYAVLHAARRRPEFAAVFGEDDLNRPTAETAKD